MTPERWQQISRIFKSAISLDSDARAAYVARHCGVDESLRAEVEKLIESHKQASADNFIGGVAAEDGAVLLIIDEAIGPQQKTFNKGQEFGAYVILDALGSGGMGEVYLARDSRLDRTVALKVLSQDVSSDKRRMQRFHQEAKVASSLNQPNILTIFEFGEVEGLTFLATEFIDGETLRDHLHGKRLKLGEILDITMQVLAALDAAHEARIVHRDIKPENVMIRRRDRVVKVLDFGLAKVTEKRASTVQGQDSEAATEFKTAPGLVMGTINYMSPEQAQAGAIDERTDIWSTGVMIYEMVAGTIPFSGATSSHTIVQILERNPAPLTKHANVPAELERIVLKAMAKSPDERYQTAKDMLIDLRALKKRLDVEAEIDRNSSPETERVIVATDEIDRWPQKKRVLVLALIAIVVVTAAIFGVSIWRSSRAGTTASVVSPVSTPLPPAERTLTYWITVQRFRDKSPYKDPFVVPGQMIFEEDYHIRVNIRSPQKGYLYVLNEGPAEESRDPEFVIVFPSSTSNDGSARLTEDQLVQIPEETWLEFDAQQGVEKLWLVFAEDAIPELERVKSYANKREKGLISDVALSKGIENFLTTHSASQPAEEKSDTRTTLKAQGKVLVYPIKLQHQ